MDLHFADDIDAELRRGLAYRTAADALSDPRGQTVRSTPRRWTVAGPEIGGRTVFRKFRSERGAAREWYWLGALAEFGFHVPKRVCWAQGSGRSVVVFLEVPGRPLDVMMREAVAAGEGAAASAYAATVVAPMVRRFHDLGLFHRDLYWNHLFATGFGGGEPAIIDVERTLRPWLRRRRWRVKDLAGLLSSAPRPFPSTAPLRFLRSYLGDGEPSTAFVRAVHRKAERIRDHVPKYG